MNQLSLDQRVRILSCLVEGNSIQATCRITGAAKGTVLQLLCTIGKVCTSYQNKTLRRLSCTKIQCDEIWSFCYAKQKNVPEQFRHTPGYGIVCTWVVLDADTKLVLCWYVGDRGFESALRFLEDLELRLKNKIQLSTDGYAAYLDAVAATFGKKINYGMVEKIYGPVYYQTEEGERDDIALRSAWEQKRRRF